ncbi:MAG TPA: hypothetical protein VHA78_01730 [Candidatus Peribacteraceae bacterium]|nr:hypothetical protein [Candidatus Peribacteraceae bacterium]
MQPTQKQAKQPSLASLEREMLTVGIVWMMVAGICVIVANVWAQGLM